MPAPKWLVVAKNECRVNTSRVRSFRPFLPILFVAVIAAYVFFVAPRIADTYVGEHAAEILSRVAFAQMRIILATLFLYSIMITIQTSLRQAPMGRLEIYLSSPIGAGVSLLHTVFNLLLGYAALLVGRRRLLAME